MLGNILTIGVVAALLGCAKAAPQTIGGVVSIPLEYTYHITPNFTGNASEAWISTKTNNKTLAGLLQQAQNATFISYDEEFSQMIGSNPKAVLVQERNDSFAFEGATFDWRGNQFWFTSSILDDKPTTIYRYNLTDNSVHEVKTALVNPNGAYYFDGYVYFVYFGSPSVQPGVARVNAVTYEAEILVNSYFGLPFNGPDDITVVPANHDGNGITTPHVYFTDNTYGSLVNRPSSDYQLPSAVWRFTPSTGALVAVIARADMIGTNGVQINANGTKLYVGEFDTLASGLDIGNTNLPGSSGVFEFDLDSRGFPINKRFFGVTRFGSPDGLKVDDYGRVWTSESEGIIVRNTEGKVIGLFNEKTLKDQKLTYANIAQVALAGNSAFFLASNRLWRVDLAQVVAKPGSCGN